MNNLFDSKSALAASATFDSTRRKPRPPLPSPEQLKAQRQAAVREGYVYVNKGNGTTVLNLSSCAPHYRWDGQP
jgi:hypothetical protein